MISHEFLTVIASSFEILFSKLVYSLGKPLVNSLIFGQAVNHSSVLYLLSNIINRQMLYITAYYKRDYSKLTTGNIGD